MRLLLFVWAVLAIMGSSALSAERRDQFGIIWCIDRKISLEKRQLRCLQSLNETQIVKKGFADILQRQRTSPKGKPLIVGEDKYLKFYQSPFLVTEALFVTRGPGIRVYFIFKDGPLQLFEAYLMVDNDDINQFGVIQTVPASKTMIRMSEKLRRGQEFARFWIAPPS